MKSVVGRAAVALVAGACMFGLASSEPHERRIARWFGAGAQPGLIFAVDVPEELGAEALYGLEDAWRQRLAAYQLRMTLPSGPHDVDIEVIGARPEDAPAIVGALTVPGHLEFLPVVSDTEAVRALFRAVHEGGYPTVSAETDYWRHDESGRTFEDFFLRGPSVEVVEAAIAEIQRFDQGAVLSPDHRIAFERVVPRADAEDPRPYVRTYVVETDWILDSSDVESAVVTFSQYTNRPEVLLTFDDEGARRFGDYTAEATGEKLAIVLDDEIRSAPVIQSAIRGGQASISMGAGGAEEMQAEAEALAAVLSQPVSLPPGITAKLTFIEEPSLAVRWAIRLGVTALAALLAFALATLVARRTVLAPVLTRPTTPRPAALAAPLAITIGLLALTVLLEHVPLPWLADWVPDVVASGGGGAAAQLSIVALGFAPVMSAYFLIEVIALIVPAWRRRRRGTPVDRRPIERAVAFLAIGFALLQGWFIATYLQSIVLDRPALTDTLLVRVTVTLTLAGGVMLMAVVAHAISRTGLINGWLALVGLGLVRWFLDLATADAPVVGLDPGPVQLAVAALAALVAIAMVMRRAAAPDRRRLPIGGIAAMQVGATVVGLLGLPYVGIEGAAKWLATRSPWFDLAAATILAALWVLPRRGRVASPFALSASVATVAFLSALPFLLPRDYQLWFHVTSGAILGVALVELAAGIARRVRMPDGAPLIAVHDVDRADAILDALHAADIPAAQSGVLARALLRFFGPYLPVVVYVPERRLDEATTLLQRHSGFASALPA